MRTALLLVVLAACGGASPEPRQPPQQQAAVEQNQEPGEPTRSPGTGDAPVGPEVAPPQAPPAQPPPRSLVPRLRDADGPVPGLDAFATKLKQDSKHCGGSSLVTTRVPGKAIAKDDQLLAALFEISSPKGLDFSDAKKAASERRFQIWLADMQRAGGAARDHYIKTLATADARAKIIALARIAQIQYRVASSMVRMEIPADVRSGEFAAEKIDAFCDKLAEVAEPLLTKAEEAATACAAASSGVPAGWWAAICTPP
jgi:hypothetical protein